MHEKKNAHIKCLRQVQNRHLRPTAYTCGGWSKTLKILRRIWNASLYQCKTRGKHQLCILKHSHSYSAWGFGIWIVRWFLCRKMKKNISEKQLLKYPTTHSMPNCTGICAYHFLSILWHSNKWNSTQSRSTSLCVVKRLSSNKCPHDFIQVTPSAEMDDVNWAVHSF